LSFPGPLEKGFDRMLADEQRHDRIAEHGGIAELIPPSDYRSIRERQGR
jgi:hypothetical protein